MAFNNSFNWSKISVSNNYFYENQPNNNMNDDVEPKISQAKHLTVIRRKNPADRRHQLSWPMRIVAPIPKKGGPRIHKNQKKIKNRKNNPKRKNSKKSRHTYKTHQELLLLPYLPYIGLLTLPDRDTRGGEGDVWKQELANLK